AVDTLREQADAQQRAGPMLPSTLKELFLPNETNETPLSIYATINFDYQKYAHNILGPGGQELRGAGQFQFEEFSPYFFLKVSDRVFVETQLEFHGTGEVEVGQAAVDFFISDCLTLEAGRFLVPYGFFN